VQREQLNHRQSRSQNAPIPIEFPVMSVVPQQITASVNDSQTTDFAQLSGKRLELVPVQEQDRQSCHFDEVFNTR
jgi:hypothetical protein